MEFYLAFQNGTSNDGMEMYFTHSELQKFTEGNALSAGETEIRKT